MRAASSRFGVDRALLARLSERAPSRWLAALALDWSIIALTFALVRFIDHPIAYALAVFPLGSRQQGLGALFHDASHHLVSKKRWLNDALGGPLSAWPLGLTLSGYRRYHLTHHRALGTARDPEMGHKTLLPQWPLPIRPIHHLHFLSDLVGAGLVHLAAAGRMTRPVRVLETALFVSLWVIVIGVAYRLGVLWMPVLWVASIATTFWSGVRLRIFTEHLGTTDTHRISMHPVFEAIVMPHSIGLHWEHHHFPSVPFHRLPELRRSIVHPKVVPLSELWARFRGAPPLASGQIAEMLGPSRAAGSAPIDKALPNQVP